VDDAKKTQEYTFGVKQKHDPGLTLNQKNVFHQVLLVRNPGYTTVN
jgi:hypothetical protein